MTEIYGNVFVPQIKKLIRTFYLIFNTFSSELRVYISILYLHALLPLCRLVVVV